MRICSGTRWRLGAVRKRLCSALYAARPAVRADALCLQEFLFTRCPAPSPVMLRLLTSSSPTHVHTFGSGLSLHFENISVSEAGM